ncbi:MAG: hypothetical protein LBU55_01315 [Elusimicrobiota bacterium]|nr:hypothetical protein [Elusimicrobiota bacterium]
MENKKSKSASWLLPFLHAKKTYEIKNAVAVVFKVVGTFLHVNKEKKGFKTPAAIAASPFRKGGIACYGLTL